LNQISARFKLNYADFKLDVDLNLPAQGVTVFFGPSGSGKTTLLRCIAGLARAQVAKLQFKGDTWQSKKRFVPPHRRPIGYVFQEASLFNHLSARGNLNYAQKRAVKTGRPIQFDQAVTLLGIESLLDRYAHQLSGGERQRIAIARALLIQPRLLLMDEPLAALDLPRKLEILPYLERIKSELDLPIIYVSHATDEVSRLADYLVAMESGHAIATGPLSETLSRIDLPLRLGEEAGVVLSGVITQRDQQWHLARVSFDGGDLWLRDAGHAMHSAVRVRVLARDISLSITQHCNTSIVNMLPATITQITTDQHPGLALIRLKVGDSYLVSRVSCRSVYALNLKPGQSIWAQIKSVAVI
jgi:molybdate transport system ATP-binding protein